MTAPDGGADGAKEPRDEQVIPEVIVREAVELYREQISEAYEKLVKVVEKPLQTLQNLQSPMSIDLNLDADERVRAYEAQLRDRLDADGCRIIELPDVEHDELVTRAVASRRPFGGHDSGYRDTLIWFSLLELAAEDDVVLLSGNDGDFGVKGTPETLHEQLVEDLASRGLAGRVTLLHDTKRFIELHVPADVQARAEFEEKLADAASPLRAAILTALESELDGQSLDDVEALRLPAALALEGSSIAAVEDIEDLQLVEVLAFARHGSVLELSGRVVASVDYFIFKSDYYSSGEDEDVTVLDSDWNDHYMWAQTETRLDFKLAVTVDSATEEVRGIDVSDLAPVEQV